MLQEQTRLMTLDEFVRLYETEGPFELINGERKPILPSVAGHGVTVQTVFFSLHRFIKAHQSGETFMRGTIVELHDSNWVKNSLSPDILFFTAARWAAYIQDVTDWKDKPFILIPDLTVEVVSANDSYTEIQDKVEEYVRLGVRLIWVVDPIRQRVRIYQGDQLTTLDETGILSGEGVIPGFEVKVGDLFV